MFCRVLRLLLENTTDNKYFSCIVQMKLSVQNSLSLIHNMKTPLPIHNILCNA